MEITEREKPDMLKDLLFVINDKGENLSEQARCDIIEKISWEWNEGKNAKKKHYGCNYWSEAALRAKLGEKFKVSDNLNIKVTKTDKSGLIHEHVVPKKLFKEFIWGLSKSEEVVSNITEIETLMNQKLLACVITSEEDANLNSLGYRQSIPNENNEVYTGNMKELNKPWARYEAAQKQGVLSKIYKISWGPKYKTITGIKEEQLG